MSKVDRRSRRRHETLRRIERAALKLFQQKGYEATSTREIAERADIAIGTLFNYFPEKRALLMHLMRGRLNLALADARAAMPKADLEAQLAHLFQTLVDCYAEERRVGRVFVKEFLFAEGDMRTDIASWTFGLIKEIAMLVEGAQARGEIDADVSAVDVAQHIFSLHYFGLVTWLGGTVPSEAAQEKQVRTALRLLLRGLRRDAA